MNLDINDVIASHLHWKAMIESLFAGRDQDMIDPKIISNHTLCDLGKWIQDSSHEHVPGNLIDVLAIAHKHFHQQAGRILLFYQSGDKHRAKQMQDEFNHSANAVIQLLTGLQENISKDVNFKNRLSGG